MELSTRITKQEWISFRRFHRLHSPATGYQCLAWVCLPLVGAACLLFTLLAWLAPGPVRFASSGLPALLLLPFCLALFLHVQKRRLHRGLDALQERQVKPVPPIAA